MFVLKKVKDIMIPLSRYPTIHPEGTLKQAVQALRTSYCQLETGMCTETGPRSVLVVAPDGSLLGILDFRRILHVLIPEIAGGLTAKLQALGVSIAFAQADAASLDETRAEFNARVIRNADVQVRDIMLKIRGTVQADASATDALKLIFRNKITKLPVFEGERLVGIVRDTDLFLVVADILHD